MEAGLTDHVWTIEEMTPVTYRNYYHRWIEAFTLDLLRFGREQVIGAILAILILAFQWSYGIIPQHHGWQAVKSLGWPYLILVVGLVLVSAIRAPVNVDRQRSTSVSELAAENTRLLGKISEDAEQVRKLNDQMADLKKPKRTPSEERIYREVELFLSKCEDDDRLVLRQLQVHDRFLETSFAALRPLPKDFSRDRTIVCLEKMTEANIVTKEFRHIGNGWEMTWQIAPGAKVAVSELL